MKALYYIIALLFTFNPNMYGLAEGGSSPYNNDGGNIIQEISNYTIDSHRPLDVSVLSKLDFIGPPPPADSFKRVYWVHGLNGSWLAWQRAAFASENVIDTLVGFPPRKLVSITNIDYHEVINMETAGWNINEQIRGNANWKSKTPGQNFFIGHSQGGLVIRALFHQKVCKNGEKVENQVSRGYVTFNTPHQGAELLSNIDIAENIMNNMCNKLAPALIIEKIDSIKKIKIPFFIVDYPEKNYLTDLISYEFIENSIDKICEIITDLTSYYLEKQFVKPITEEYKVGAHYLSDLNNSCVEVDTGVYKIAFYGTEPQEYIFARTLHYLLDDPNTGPHDGRDYGYFGADRDDILWGAMKKWKSTYIAKQEEYETRANNLRKKFNRTPFCNELLPHILSRTCWLFGIFSGPHGYAHCQGCEKLYYTAWENHDISNAFQKGVDWFEGIDQEWQKFIGAYQLKEIKRDCVCTEIRIGDGPPLELPENGSTLPLPHIGSPPSDMGRTVSFPSGDYSKKDCALQIAIATGTDPGNWRCNETYDTEVNIISNDGILLADTQRSLPYMTLKEDVDPKKDLKMDDTSHMQARNNKALKEKLFNLYEGDYHNFFYTEELD